MTGATDIKVFFSDFAEPAVWKHGTAPEKTISVVFDDAAEDVDVYDTVSARNPRIYVMDAETSGMATGDPITVRGIAYTVAPGRKPDGQGISLIRLKKA